MEFDTLLVEMEAEETIEDDIISRQFRITQSKEARNGVQPEDKAPVMTGLWQKLLALF